ncbi:hypothetical protein [Streptomyces sp. NPDC046685]|uniref:hypothetical protein n=1 Tax=Streptomyces sp. NPDC046685 TaxID=3157202 RepID=UPI0033DD80CF
MPKAGTYSTSKTRKIQVPDYITLRANAEREVKDELGGFARPDDRVARAAEIIRQADVEIATHIDDRDAAAASLWFYEHTTGLARILGLYPTAYRSILYKALYGVHWQGWKEGDPFPKELPTNLSREELVSLAEQQNVPRIEDAAQRLPELARVVAVAKARRAAAMPFMQDAALALSEPPYDWDGEKIANHAGIAVSLVWAHWAAARKRQRS